MSSSTTYSLPNIPTAEEAKKKAEVVRSTKLSQEDQEITLALTGLADGVRAAVEETLPNKDGGYTIIVSKRSLNKHFDKVMNLFHTDMKSKDWTVVYEERIQYFPFRKTELVITFAPTPNQQISQAKSSRTSKDKSPKASSVSNSGDSDAETRHSSLKKRSRHRRSPPTPLSEVTDYNNQ